MTELIREQGVSVVRLGPQYDALDEPTMRELSDLLLSAAKESDPPLVVIDFAETAYVGSTFIELLVRAWKRLKERGGGLAVCNLGAFCAEVFRVARLDTLWPSYPSREAAIAALQAES